jgi:hypothetical protein
MAVLSFQTKTYEIGSKLHRIQFQDPSSFRLGASLGGLFWNVRNAPKRFRPVEAMFYATQWESA